MQRCVALIAATAALVAAAGVVPSTAAAAEGQWRCASTPLSGTLLGQPINAPSVGSAAGECGNAVTAPALQLPSLLGIEALKGITALTDTGAIATAGLAKVSVGSIPVPLPAIPVPEALKKISVPLPGTSIPVATVDLTPAIEAIQSLPSRKLLDLGVLYSQVTGTCQNGRASLAGGSRILDANVLGLPVDASNTVDSAVSLIDTSNIALSALDLRLAKVTLLGGLLSVDTATVLQALKPILANLPPIQIPAQIARVKLTPASQTTEDGMLVQRALRVEIGLLGQSLADLSIGRAAVGGGACAQPAKKEPVALECTKRKLALLDVLPQGDRVRLYGAADKSLVGRTASIVFHATGETVARVKIGKGGRFTTTAPMPDAGIRYTNRARYIAQVGREKSLNLKLHRRLLVEKVRSRGGRVTIVGRVVAPLATTPQTITLKRRVSCRKLEVVKRFKPRSDGTFTVSVKSPRNLAATVYRLQTQVREKLSNPRLYPTFTLPRAVDL